MNILILNWRDPKHPLAGGAEITLLHHAKYWISKGDTVIWYASHFNGAKKYEEFEGINIVREGSHYTVLFRFFLYYLKELNSSVDIVIDCFHFVPFFTPLYVRNKKIIALIHEVAGNVWYENIFFPFAFLGYILEPFFIRLYRKFPFITVSNSTLNDLKKIGIAKKNIHVIHNGVDPLKIRKNLAKEKLPTVIFLGRVSKDKGIEDALLMLELLIRENKNLKLWIIGKFENKKYEKKVKKLLDKFKVRKNCVLYGYVDDERKGELLRKAWILVHPSAREGWGMNVIEANSVGTPAVGYNVQGLRDSIVDGITGLLVEPDAISLANAVEDLLHEKKRLRLLSKNSKKWANQFSWDVSVKKAYALLDNINK